MTTTDTQTAVERMATEKAWSFFLRASQLDARLGEWEESTTEAGVLLSAALEGPDAAAAFLRAAQNGECTLDYSSPDRLACVWQSNGVWVELWCPASLDRPTPPATPAPVPMPAPKRRLLRGPGGRLPFTRRNKTRKETNPA